MGNNYIIKRYNFSQGENKMDEIKNSNKGFFSGFGTGLIIVVISSLVYIFGYGEQPVPAVTKSSLEVYVISTVNAKALTQLKEIIPNLSDEQKASFDKAASAFFDNANGAKQALAIVKQDVPIIEVTILPANDGCIEENGDSGNTK